MSKVVCSLEDLIGFESEKYYIVEKEIPVLNAKFGCLVRKKDDAYIASVSEHAIRNNDEKLKILLQMCGFNIKFQQDVDIDFVENDDDFIFIDPLDFEDEFIENESLNDETLERRLLEEELLEYEFLKDKFIEDKFIEDKLLEETEDELLFDDLLDF